jgi:dihydrofolate synthase/folylpolyglutamate synthase
VISSFEKAEQYLESLRPSSQKTIEGLRLERITYLLELLGNPHKKLKFIHIGGTSGKGSVAYLLSQILVAQGYTVGLHVTPHLQAITERIQVNNKPVAGKKLVDYVNWLTPLINKVDRDLGLGKPTYFETTVAIAFHHFWQKRVDIAVVEVGIGGTLDGTNVINPLVSVITNVGLDHTKTLGGTVQKIAKDKAGIIKGGAPVVSGVKQVSVKKIIAEKTAKAGAKLFLLDRGFDYRIRETGLDGSIFDFRWQNKNYKNLRLGILGVFQVGNTALALASVHLLTTYGFSINEKKLTESLKNIKIPGRFEIVPPPRPVTKASERRRPRLRWADQKRPLTILDGAHNPMKIKTLAHSLSKIFPRKKFVFLIAFKKGKDKEKMLKVLIPYAKILVITEFNKETDALGRFTTSTKNIEDALSKLEFSGKIVVEKNSTKALERAKGLATKDTPIIATGSLYLIGEIRDIFFP